MKRLPQKFSDLQTKAAKLITLYAYLKKYKIPPNYIVDDFHHRIQNTNLVELKMSNLNMYQKFFEKLYALRHLIQILPPSNERPGKNNFKAMSSAMSVLEKHEAEFEKLKSMINALSPHLSIAKKYALKQMSNYFSDTSRFVQILSKLLLVRSMRRFDKFMMEQSKMNGKFRTIPEYIAYAKEILEEDQALHRITESCRKTPSTVIDSHFEKFMNSTQPLTPVLKRQYTKIMTLLKSIRRRRSIASINDYIKPHHTLEEMIEYLKYVKMSQISKNPMKFRPMKKLKKIEQQK